MRSIFKLLDCKDENNFLYLTKLSSIFYKNFKDELKVNASKDYKL